MFIPEKKHFCRGKITLFYLKKKIIFQNKYSPFIKKDYYYLTIFLCLAKNFEPFLLFFNQKHFAKKYCLKILKLCNAMQSIAEIIFVSQHNMASFS
jgi:hypothetical protein